MTQIFLLPLYLFFFLFVGDCCNLQKWKLTSFTPREHPKDPYPSMRDAAASSFYLSMRAQVRGWANGTKKGQRTWVFFLICSLLFYLHSCIGGKIDFVTQHSLLSPLMVVPQRRPTQWAESTNIGAHLIRSTQMLISFENESGCKSCKSQTDKRIKG